MNLASPRVSVVIPTYNHGHFILETLESVFSQTFTDYEIIIINDGSPDDTAERLRFLIIEDRVRYFDQTNGGQAAARNHGLAEARGEFIAFLDDDDVWPPDKLAWQVEWLEAHESILLVAGSYTDIDTAGERLTHVPIVEGEVTLERLLGGGHFRSPGQTLIRTAPLREVGGFDPNIWGGDDYELWLRLCQRGNFAAVSKMALYYRRHANNASRNAERMYWNLLPIAAPYLRRLPKAILPQIERNHYRFLYDYGVRNVFRTWLPHQNQKNKLGLTYPIKAGTRVLVSVLSIPPLRRLFFEHIFSLVARRFRITVARFTRLCEVFIY